LAALLVSGSALADGWKGAGELGLALSRGNSETESVNAKLGFTLEDEQWKHALGLAILRQKGEAAGAEDLVLTANRYELSGSSGYKFDERSYLNGSLRYENDDFAPFEYQAIAALSYGYFAIKSDATELLFEAGPGYRRFKEVASGDTDGELILRGFMGFKHVLTETTSFENTLLIEAGSDNTFAQNDAGLVVKMSDALALKAGLQLRHNTDVAPGLEKTDSLFTTNLVYNF
jgi:putative salt-induced outer membrane protein